MTTTSDPDKVEVSRGLTGGTSVGQSATDPVAFHGATPVAQASAIASVGASIASVAAAVNSIIVALENKGLIAS